jgi:hypothetical protein
MRYFIDLSVGGSVSQDAVGSEFLCLQEATDAAVGFAFDIIHRAGRQAAPGDKIIIRDARGEIRQELGLEGLVCEAHGRTGAEHPPITDINPHSGAPGTSG